MAEATISSVKANVIAAFESYIAELKQAAPHWERKPAAGGEGEDAWSARQVAEHIAGSGPFFAAGIAQAIGVPGPTPAPVSLPDPRDAVVATEGGHAALMGVVDQVKDEQLSMPIDHPRLGKQTLGGVIGIVAYHLNDHAGQLKALREA